MLNRIILIGRLTRDPEAKYTPSGVPVTTFSIAVDRIQSAEARQQGLQKETDFIDIVTWRQTAEFVANYIGKGRLVAVEGKLQIRSWVSQEGQQRKSAEVVADNVRPLDRRPDGEGGGNQDGGGYDNYPQQQQQPAAAAPAPAPQRSYEQQRPPAPPAGRGPAPAAARPPARNQPPAPSSDLGGGDDYDDLTDPFAE